MNDNANGDVAKRSRNLGRLAWYFERTEYGEHTIQRVAGQDVEFADTKAAIAWLTGYVDSMSEFGDGRYHLVREVAAMNVKTEQVVKRTITEQN